LDEAFIRISDAPVFLRKFIGPKLIAWIHPSYRDLVIESISKNPGMRLRYLERGGMPAISLALSQAGGATGQRIFPLMIDDESWKSLEKACIDQLRNGPKEDETSILATMISSTTGDPPHRDRLERLANAICETLRQKWDEAGSKIGLARLEQFYTLAERSSQYLPSPDLTSTWEAAWEEVRSVIYDSSTDSFSSPDELVEWAGLCDLIQKNEPRFLRRVGFPSVSAEAAGRIAKIAEMDTRRTNTQARPSD
jgi:hypothetical protein